MPSIRLAADLLAEPLDDADTAVFVPASGESHVVDGVGTLLLDRLRVAPASESELATALLSAGAVADDAAATAYLAALIPLWRGAGILAA